MIFALRSFLSVCVLKRHVTLSLGRGGVGWGGAGTEAGAIGPWATTPRALTFDSGQWLPLQRGPWPFALQLLLADQDFLLLLLVSMGQ